jgi:hypothetical protein
MQISGVTEDQVTPSESHKRTTLHLYLGTLCTEINQQHSEQLSRLKGPKKKQTAPEIKTRKRGHTA